MLPDQVDVLPDQVDVWLLFFLLPTEGDEGSSYKLSPSPSFYLTGCNSLIDVMAVTLKMHMHIMTF